MTSRGVFRALGPSCLSVALVVAGGGPVWADTIRLKNGRELHGRLVFEGPDVIRVGIGGGTITVRRSEVDAIIDDDTGEAKVERSSVPAAAPAADATSPRTATGGFRRERRRAGSVAAQPPTSAEAWEWPTTLTSEQVAELTPLRDRYLGELAALGPSAEERLNQLEATPGEKAEMAALIQRLAFRRAHVRRRGSGPATPRQRVGSTNMQRENAKEDLVEFGLKAIPPLTAALRSESQWTRRLSAQALADLSKGVSGVEPADARSVLYRLDAPERLIELLDHSGEIDSPFIRREAAAALSSITERRVDYPASLEPEPTIEELQATRAWQQWWRAEQSRWSTEQQELEAKRAELLDRLVAVREGRAPEEEENAPR